ncbi:MAG: hypothetical protein ACOY3Y_03430 [Acidobacteriota bacterium]
MTLRGVVAIASIVLAGCTTAGTTLCENLHLAGRLWVAIDSPWLSPPAELGNPSRSAAARVVRFSDDGAFAMIACTITEYQKTLYISQGDGQAVFLGTWRRDGSEIHADVRLVSETVRRPTFSYPGPSELHRFRCISSGPTREELLEGSRRFSPTDRLAQPDFDQYVKSGSPSP